MRDGWGGQQRDFAAVVSESCKPRSRRTVILLKKKYSRCFYPDYCSLIKKMTYHICCRGIDFLTLCVQCSFK